MSFDFVSFCTFSSVKPDVFSYLTPCFHFTHFRTLPTSSSLFLSLPFVVSFSVPYDGSFFFFLISVFAFVLSLPLLFILFTSPPLKFHRFLLCASFSVSSLSSLIVSPPSPSPLPPLLSSPLPPRPSLFGVVMNLWFEPVVTGFGGVRS